MQTCTAYSDDDSSEIMDNNSEIELGTADNDLASLSGTNMNSPSVTPATAGITVVNSPRSNINSLSVTPATAGITVVNSPRSNINSPSVTPATAAKTAAAASASAGLLGQKRKRVSKNSEFSELLRNINDKLEEWGDKDETTTDGDIAFAASDKLATYLDDVPADECSFYGHRYFQSRRAAAIAIINNKYSAGALEILKREFRRFINHEKNLFQ